MRYEGVNPGEHPEFVVVGLGNPGAPFVFTRQNAGYKVIEYVDSTARNAYDFRKKRFLSLEDKCIVDEHLVDCFKPQLQMINCGLAVRTILEYYCFTPDRLVVIHDDVNLPLGKFKISTGSGSVGHKGVDSIIMHLRSKNFKCVHIGVGDVPEDMTAREHLLSNFSIEEYDILEKVSRVIVYAISAMFEYGMNDAMEAFNHTVQIK